MKQTDYANELGLQVAMKQNQATANKLNERVSDFQHLDTVDNFSPYGKSGSGSPFKDAYGDTLTTKKPQLMASLHNSLSPMRTGSLGISQSLPFLTPLAGKSAIASQMRMPNINPVLSAAGLQTFHANPLSAAGSPMGHPPVPLVPPSLFAPIPSLPQLKDPNMSNWYWAGRSQGIHGDYIRGHGLNHLLAGGTIEEGDKLKKALYRNDLLNQMGDNNQRRVEQYKINQVRDELEEERLRRERLGIEKYDGWEGKYYNQRRADNNERVNRALKGHWHRSDEDKYNYKRFRKGGEQVEAWWLDPYPYQTYPSDGRKHPGGRFPYDDWQYRKYWSNPNWRHSRDPYPYPPPPGNPHERDWWWWGDREQPWRKERGYWQNGKFVALDVANNVQERLGKEVEQLRQGQSKKEIDLQIQLNQIKKEAADADAERGLAIAGINELKKKLEQKEVKGDRRHDYIYNQLMNSMHEREGLVHKRTETLPEVSTFPRIDKVQFRLPERPTERYDHLNSLPKKLKFVNEHGRESLHKMHTKVNIFDADYLNQVNTRRLDDLQVIDPNSEKERSVMNEFLERETKAATIRLHEPDAKNELMNKDILLPTDNLTQVDYEAPLDVVSRFKGFPSLDTLAAQSNKHGKALTQSMVLRSQTNEVY